MLFTYTKYKHLTKYFFSFMSKQPVLNASNSPAKILFDQRTVLKTAFGAPSNIENPNPSTQSNNINGAMKKILKYSSAQVSKYIWEYLEENRQ